MPRVVWPVIAINKKGPANLPDPVAAIDKLRCDAGNANRSRRGFALVDESRGGAPYAWVKWGWETSMGEARTQDYVWQVLNRNPDPAVRVPCVYLAFQLGSLGYIVMEYIEGTTCDDSDAQLVAAALQPLIAIRAPTAEPGPARAGGGPIQHLFFLEDGSNVTYRSVAWLQGHINGVSAFRIVPP